MRKWLVTNGQVSIQIPKDPQKIRDLFVEARHYQIKELERVLCSYDWYTNIASFLSGGSNPFHSFASTIRNIRAALVASSGVGIIVGTQNEELMEDIKGIFVSARDFMLGRDNSAIPSKLKPDGKS